MSVIGFISLISEEKIKDLVKWYVIDDIKDLAFDHREIIDRARLHIKQNTDSSIVQHFMPSLFPLNKLQEVYQILEEKEYDNRN